jgi:inner membrane transporter RhtA
VAGPRRDLTAGPVAGGGILLASCLSIQVGAALATTTFARVGAAGAAGWRFALAAVLVVVIARPRLSTWTWARWREVLLFGLAAAANEVCLYQALQRLPLGMAVTLEFLGPLALALAGVRRVRDLGCALLALVGVIALCATKLSADPVGIAFALAAAVGWAMYILCSQRAGSHDRPLDSLSVALCVAAVITAPLSLSHTVAATHTATLAVLTVVALLGTALPYMLEIAALRRLSASTAGVLFSIEPAIAALVGLIILGQSLTISQIAGVALVVTAGATILQQPAG